MKVTLSALAFVLVAASVSAQYVDHRTYPANFAVLSPGDPVADRPGLVWQHDGGGWYWAAAAAPEPTGSTRPPEGCPQPFNPYGMSDEVLARCLQKPPNIDPWTHRPFTFEIGGVYRDPYGARALVIGIATDIGSPRRIVTVRVISSSFTNEVGELQASYEDRIRWIPLRPGEPR